MKEAIAIALGAAIVVLVVRPDIARDAVSRARSALGLPCCARCAGAAAPCGEKPNLTAMGVEVGGSSGDGLDDGGDAGAVAGVALARGCVS